jgi:hypothetical protein
MRREDLGGYAPPPADYREEHYQYQSESRGYYQEERRETVKQTSRYEYGEGQTPALGGMERTAYGGGFAK